MAAWLNKTVFFARLRRSLWRDGLPRRAVEGLEFLIARRPVGWSDPWFSYALATVYHETAHTMQPIRERGGAAYFQRYEGRRDLGNLRPGDGVRFHGRGYVQITGRRNYEDWARRLGLPLVERPDLTMEPETSARILFEGMEKGTFTGKSLRSYTSGGDLDFVRARRIINGTDRAQLIAGYAEEFLAALAAARVAEATTEDEADAQPTGKGAGSTTIWSQVAAFLAAGGAAALQALGQLDWKTAAVLTVAGVAAGALWTIRERLKKAREHGI